jgi:hypothetical protein
VNSEPEICTGELLNSFSMGRFLRLTKLNLVDVADEEAAWDLHLVTARLAADRERRRGQQVPSDAMRLPLSVGRS